jgi:hypothetical protein
VFVGMAFREVFGGRLLWCFSLVWVLFWGLGWVGVFGGCLLCALLESLILAQDERWRRA